MSWNQGMLRVAARAGLALGLLLPCVASPRAAAPTSPPPSTGPETTVTEVGGKALKDWIHDLYNEDPSVREEAIRAIPYFGPAASEAVPTLVEHSIGDRDESPRSKAILALGMIKIEDKDRDKVIRALGQRLEPGVENQGPIRYDIALVLMGFGKDASLALNGLLDGAEDPSCWEVRRACLAVLVEAGQTKDGPNPRATRAMMHALQPDERAAAVRLQGVMGLAQMGRSHDPQLLNQEVAAVKNMMKDHDKTVVIWAHLSMMALSDLDDADIAYLTAAAKSGELERYRVQGIGALGMVGTKEKKVVPTLVDFLSEKASPAIVGAACQALGTVGEPGEKAEKALIDISKNTGLDEPVRCQAIYALAMIAGKDKNAKAALPALIDLLKTETDPNVVMTVCHALGMMEEPPAAAREAVLALKNDERASKSVKDYAEKVLETMGKGAMH